MRKIATFKSAKRLEIGVMVCGAGYRHCPMGNENHYHCGTCGGITGMMGHYAGENKPFSCQEPDVELVPAE